jgi:hypothetical protein
MCGENNPAKRPDVRKKISEGTKGKNTGDSNPMRRAENKEKMSILMRGTNNPMFGKHPSEEAKRKMSEFQRSKPPDSIETREKKSAALKGIPKSADHKRKLSEANIKNANSDGYINSFYGKKHKKETKEKLSEFATKRFANKENCTNWQGGISYEPYDINFNDKLKNKIRNRDNNTCQNPHCNKSIKAGDVHHINYIKLDCM